MKETRKRTKAGDNEATKVRSASKNGIKRTENKTEGKQRKRGGERVRDREGRRKSE